MKKLILFAIAIMLVSCGKAPLEKYNTAKQCLDSLKAVGGMNSGGFYLLQDEFKDADSIIKRQESMLFKKYDEAKYMLDDVIVNARRFIMTNDKQSIKWFGKITAIPTSVSNSNIVKLEVELTFDSKQDPLKIANQVDESVRRSNFEAKLISVKIIQ